MQAIIGQISGIVAMLITFSSYQMKTQKGVLVTLTAATFFNGLSYLLLGATSGFALNVVCIVRNICFCYQRTGTRINRISAIGFAAAMCLLTALTWQGPVSLLIMIALATNTIFLSLGNPQVLRYSIFFTSSLVLGYNVVVFTVGGIVNELIAIVSSFIGVLRFRKTARPKPQ